MVVARKGGPEMLLAFGQTCCERCTFTKEARYTPTAKIFTKLCEWGYQVQLRILLGRPHYTLSLECCNQTTKR